MNEHDMIPDGEPYVLPASFGQERLWLLDRLGAGNAYHLTGAVRLDGLLDPAAMGRAIERLVERHEVLRTTFEFGPDGALTQLVHPRMDIPLAVPPAPRPTLDAARRTLTEHFDRPFDLARGPLLRAAVVRFTETAWLFGVSMHHIVSDGWSIGVIFAELAGFYRAEISGVPAALPDLPIQYGDFAAWQRESVEAAGPEFAGYWRERMAGAAPVEPAIPSGEPRPGSPLAGANIPVAVPKAMVDAIGRLARQEAATPFMVLLAAYTAVLARWTEQDDIVVGTPVAGRERPELQGLIGFFVNTLPLRVRVDHESPFRVLLREVREACLGAYRHQDFPFERIVQVSGADRLPGRTPLVGAIIALQNTPVPRWDVPGLTCEQVELADIPAQFGLNLYLSEAPDGGLTGRLVHARPQWETSDARRLTEGWLALLAGAVARPGAPVGRLPLGASAGTSPEPEPPVADGLVHQWIEKAAREHADRTAVTAGEESVTYRELDDRADRWARVLREHGAGPGRLVAICMRRSIGRVAATLGVLKSGAAYLPLDPGHPRSRIDKIIADAAPAVIVTDAGAAVLFDGRTEPAVLRGTEVPDVPPLERGDGDPASLVYVTYTSGSTGTPKGAMNTHRGVVNRIRAAQCEFGLVPGEALLHKTPLSFDISAWEWMWPLTAGARLVLAAPGGHRDPRHLAALITRESVTTCHFVPSMLPAFLAEPAAAGCAGVLRRVLCGGEELPPAVARRLREVLPDTELYNAYGPAEAAIEVSWHRVGRDDLALNRIPIGRPLPGVRLVILDRRGEPVPPGVPGELHIGGVAVGRGYLGQPALTAERFVPDPFAAGGSRLYRTGDRARRLPDGSVDFLGRYDHQVKLRGIRIEPGEIEAALGEHPDVDQAAVMVRGSTGADKQLVAYAGCPGSRPTAGALRSFLLGRLPQTFVPGAFVILAELPVTRNGKLDRAALPDPRHERPRGEEAAPPRTPAERLLAGIWSDVLQTPGVGVWDNFYELGGNSLRAVQVFQRAQEEGLLLPLELMLGDHTIEQLATRLGADPEETLHGIGRLLT